jgi:hypothetical protein
MSSLNGIQYAIQYHHQVIKDCYLLIHHSWASENLLSTQYVPGM